MLFIGGDRDEVSFCVNQSSLSPSIFKLMLFSWSFFQAIFNLFEWLEFQNYDSGDQLVSSHIKCLWRTILGHYDVTIKIWWRHEPASRLKLSSVDNETLLRARWISVCSLDWSWSNSESTKYYSNVMTNILKWVICSWVTITSLWVIFSINDSNLSRNLRVLLRLHHLKKIAPKQPFIISKLSALERKWRSRAKYIFENFPFRIQPKFFWFVSNVLDMKVSLILEPLLQKYRKYFQQSFLEFQTSPNWCYPNCLQHSDP